MMRLLLQLFRFFLPWLGLTPACRKPGSTLPALHQEMRGKALSLPGADPGRLVLLRDESTSMAQWGAVFVHCWNTHIARLAERFPATVVRLLGVSGKVLCRGENVRFAEIPPLLLAEFHSGPGGILRPGSRLIDALDEAALCVEQWRREGYAGPTGILMLADGWARADTQPAERVKMHLASVRMLGAAIRFIAFVPEDPAGRKKMSRFLEEVGLKDDEVMLFYHGEADVEESIRNAFEASETAVGLMTKVN